MNVRITCTFSSESSDLDNWGIGLRGITKKWVGACGLTSLKATHCKKKGTIKNKRRRLFPKKY
jgi:hypothetical protein